MAQHGLDDTVHLRQALRSQELTAVDDVDVGESGGIGKGIAECRGGLGHVAVGWEERLVTGLGGDEGAAIDEDCGDKRQNGQRHSRPIGHDLRRPAESFTAHVEPSFPEPSRRTPGRKHLAVVMTLD